MPSSIISERVRGCPTLLTVGFPSHPLLLALLRALLLVSLSHFAETPIPKENFSTTPSSAKRGKKGKVSSTYYLTGNIPHRSFEGCAKICLKMKTGACKAMEFKEVRNGNNICKLLDKCVKGSHVKTSQCPFHYFDKTCFTC